MATNLDTTSVPITYKDLSGGLNSAPSGFTVDNEASDLQSIDFSKFGSALQRGGYFPLNSSLLSGTSQGLYWYKSLYDTVPVTVNNGRIYKMDNLDGIWDDITGMVSLSSGGIDSNTTLMLHYDGLDQNTIITDSSLSLHSFTNTETYDSYTTLMLHCQSTGTSLTITDSSLGTHTMLVVGSHTSLQTSQYKFGSYTLSNTTYYFTGSSLALLNPVDNNTVLLLHCDGDNASTTFLDSSPYPHTMTAYGTAQVSNAQTKLGSGSLKLDGNVSTYISTPNSSAFNFGTGDFTLECYTYLVSYNGVNYNTWIDCGYYTSGLRFAWSSLEGGIQLYLAGTPYVVNTSLATNTWYHVAAVRSSGSLYFFVNGTQVGSTITGVTGNVNSSYPTLIGKDIDSSYPVDGYIDELRISNVARYTSNFNVPSVPYGIEYVSCPDSNDFYFGTGNFTIDGWLYPTSFPSGVSNSAYVVSQYSTTGYNWGIYLDSIGNLNVNFVSGGTTMGAATTSGTSVSLGTWTHFAVIRSSTSCSIYLNGTSQSLASTTAFSTNDVGNFNSPFYLGTKNLSGGSYQGYLSELRVSKSVRWNTDFLPYSAPYGQVDTVSSMAKFGTGSGEFKGYERVISADSTDWYFGANPFTIDFWYKMNDIYQSAKFIGQYESSTKYWYLQKDTNANGNKLSLQFSNTTTQGSYVMTSNWNPTVGTWYHLAFERIGTGTGLFINGIMQSMTAATIFSTNDVGNLAAPLQISGQNNVGYLNGWMGELRVSKGVARWTTDFTPYIQPYNDSTAGFDKQDFDTFLGYVLGTGKSAIPWQWLITNSTASNMSLMTGLTGSQFVKKFQNYVLLANVIVNGIRYPSRIYWSTIKSLTSWDAADYLDVSRDDGDEITGLRVLGDRLVVYKNTSIYIVSFTGDADIPFTLQKSNSAVGCSAPYSIQDAENGHIFASFDGVYLFDGNNSYKMSDKINLVWESVNKAKFSECTSLYHRTKNTYWLSMPKGSSLLNNMILTWNGFLNAWSQYAGISASSLAIFLVGNSEERPYFGDYSGYIYRADYGIDDYPQNVRTAINSFYWTNWKYYDSLCDKKGVAHSYINHAVQSNGNLNFGYSYDFYNGIQYLSSFTMLSILSQTAMTTRRDLIGRGTFVRFYVGNNSTNTTYRVDGFGQYVTRESKS